MFPHRGVTCQPFVGRTRSASIGGTMKIMIRLMAIIAALFVSQLCMAQAPAGAPAGSTALCNDGSYFNGATKQWRLPRSQRASKPGLALPAPFLQRRLPRRLHQDPRANSCACSGCHACCCRGASASSSDQGGFHESGIYADYPGTGRWPRPGLGEYRFQCLSLPRHQVLRHHQSWCVYDRGSGEGQGCPRRCRQALHQVIL